MGLLEKLWDDTIAGPLPDSGLGSLRHNSSSSPSSAAAAAAPAPISSVPSRVTRALTILRPPGAAAADSGSGSVPSSPAGSSPPDSPFTFPASWEGDRRRRRRNLAAAAGAERLSEAASPRSPTVYDWVVISSLDR